MSTVVEANSADGQMFLSLSGSSSVCRRLRSSSWTLAVAAVVLLASSMAAAEPRDKKTPAELTEVSKNPALADDFLRFGFLAPGTVPTQLANPAATRTFMTYSEFFEPSVPLEKAVRYVGLEPRPSDTFLGIRCKDPNLEVLDPRLAKWPEVFAAIEEDFGGKYTCPPTTNDPENQILCIARSFNDVPMTTATEALANLYDVAVQITGDPALQTAIRRDYGIDLGFSGLGLAINGSGNPSFLFTAEHSLENAVVPEYLVRNAQIAQAGCHCILVPSYPGRDEDRVDPDFIWNVGTPECKTVNRLPGSRKHEGERDKDHPRCGRNR